MKSEKEMRNKIEELKCVIFDKGSIDEYELRAEIEILEWVLESEVEQ